MVANAIPFDILFVAIKKERQIMQIKRSERQERAKDNALAAIELIKKAVSDAGGDMSVLNNLGAILKCSEYQAQCRLARYLTYLCEDVSRKYLIGEVSHFSMKVYKVGPYRYSIKDFGEEWGFAIVKLLEVLGLSASIKGSELVGSDGGVCRHVTFTSKDMPQDIEQQLQVIYNKTFAAYQDSLKEVENVEKQIKNLQFQLSTVKTSVAGLASLLDNEAALLQEATKSYLR